jgi:tRNA-specific 2-thiouridylase
MSGGVDSSVAAALLLEQGCDVVGLFMRLGHEAPADDACSTSRRQGCCSAADAADARFVAGRLGIPFYALNFEAEFGRIIDYFADEYARGRTPNPCVICNEHLKFGRLLEYARAVGADGVATGHYARIEHADGRPKLLRGRDRDKDQSYVLFSLTRDALERTQLPVGAMTKDEVRRKAEAIGLPVHDKPDSTDICFAPDRDYARIVRERRPDAFQPGEVRDPSGRVIGRHEGIGHYTIGQRRGLGIALGSPAYVTEINVQDRVVTLGPREHLMRRELIASQIRWFSDPPAEPIRANVQIRYGHRAAPATVEALPDGQMRALFDEAQPAITPGQAAVVYREDEVLGGGWIEKAGAGEAGGQGSGVRGQGANG